MATPTMSAAIPTQGVNRDTPGNAFTGSPATSDQQNFGFGTSEGSSESESSSFTRPVFNPTQEAINQQYLQQLQQLIQATGGLAAFAQPQYAQAVPGGYAASLLQGIGTRPSTAANPYEAAGLQMLQNLSNPNYQWGTGLNMMGQILGLQSPQQAMGGAGGQSMVPYGGAQLPPSVMANNFDWTKYLMSNAIPAGLQTGQSLQGFLGNIQQNIAGAGLDPATAQRVIQQATQMYSQALAGQNRYQGAPYMGGGPGQDPFAQQAAGGMGPTTNLTSELAKLFESQQAPALINSMTASGMGRSGALAEALSKAGATLVPQAWEQAQQGGLAAGTSALGLGGAIDTRYNQALQDAFKAAYLPQQAQFAEWLRPGAMLAALMGGLPTGQAVGQEGESQSSSSGEQSAFNASGGFGFSQGGSKGAADYIAPIVGAAATGAFGGGGIFAPKAA